MGSVSVWIGVAGGSKLRISVRGKKSTDINFIADARVVPSSGAETLLPEHKLNPGPHAVTIREGISYAVRVAMKFLGETTQRAVVTAELHDAQGVTIPNLDGEAVYSFEVSGKQGQPIRRCTLVTQRVS
jgi:hypothetical protein